MSIKQLQKSLLSKYIQNLVTSHHVQCRVLVQVTIISPLDLSSDLLNALPVSPFSLPSFFSIEQAEKGLLKIRSCSSLFIALQWHPPHKVITIPSKVEPYLFLTLSLTSSPFALLSLYLPTAYFCLCIGHSFCLESSSSSFLLSYFIQVS